MATVLIVDDHATNRDFLATLLGYRGHRVLEADDGAKALVLAAAEHPDLVITDLLMPVMDGYEFVRELRDDPELAATEVIFFTANYLMAEVRPVAEALGVRRMLPKPAEPEEVLAVLDQVLGLEPAVSAPVRPVEEFDRVYLRALSAKLVEKVRELESAQGALQASEALFRSLAESAPIGIFSLDSDAAISYANARLREICGLADDEPDSAISGALLHAADRDAATTGVRDAMARGGQFGMRARLPRDGGTRWVDLKVAPVGDGHDQVTYVGTVEDVTETVDAERRRAEIEERMRTSERLESLGQLAAGVAHDFNNLLGAMLNYAQFVRDGIDVLVAEQGATPSLAQIGDDAATIARAAERAAELTHQLLLFGRRDVMHTEAIDLNAVITEAQKLLGRTIGEQIGLRSQLAADLPPVHADRSRLEQVVVNLVVNGRDAIDGTGSVLISTDAVELDAAAAAAQPGARAGRYCRLTVADDGVGMNDDTRARIFEPFFTTKPTGKGTGLGMATVYGVVHQLEGFVEVVSALGKGTAVQVYLPVAAPALSVAGAEERDVAFRGQGEVILVVEDDDDLRAVTARILDAAGYRTVPIARGRAALAYLADRANRVDVLLTDMVMPGMSGTELAERSGQIRPRLPVVYMSGYAGNLNVDGPSAVDVLAKPFTKEALQQRVATALAQGSNP